MPPLHLSVRVDYLVMTMVTAFTAGSLASRPHNHTPECFTVSYQSVSGCVSIRIPGMVSVGLHHWGELDPVHLLSVYLSA